MTNEQAGIHQSMKIGMVTLHPLAQSMGTSSIIQGFAFGLSEQGAEVHILAPGEETRRIGKNLTIHGYGNLLGSFGHALLGRIYGSQRLASKTLLRPRILDVITRQLERVVTRWTRNLGLDVVEGEQELSSKACLDAASKGGAQCVSRFQNVWLEECLETGLLTREDPTFDFLTEVNASILERSSLVLTPTKFMRDYLIGQYGHDASERIACVPPGTFPRVLSRDGYEDPRTIVFAGTISSLQGLDIYLEAVARIGNLADCCICGKGDMEHYLKSMSKQLYPALKFKWFEHKPDYYRYLSTCYAGVVPWKNSLSRRLGFPMKLLDYMSVGLPVIGPKIGSWSDLIEQHDIGILCRPNPIEWAQGLRSLLENKTQAQSMGQNALDLCNNTFNWKTSTDLLLEAYRRCS